MKLEEVVFVILIVVIPLAALSCAGVTLITRHYMAARRAAKDGNSDEIVPLPTGTIPVVACTIAMLIVMLIGLFERGLALADACGAK